MNYARFEFAAIRLQVFIEKKVAENRNEHFPILNLLLTY